MAESCGPPGATPGGRWDGCCTRGIVDLHEAMDNTQEAGGARSRRRSRGKVPGEGGKGKLESGTGSDRGCGVGKTMAFVDWECDSLILGDLCMILTNWVQLIERDLVDVR